MIQYGGHGDNRRFQWRYEHSLMFDSKKECIIPSQEEFQFKCGNNMRGTASSYKKAVRNDLCNPALDKPRSFEWSPNDKRMWVT